MIARQLPVYSPVTFAGVLRAGTALARSSEAEALKAELSARYRAPRVELWGSGTQALQVAIAVAHRRVGGAVALPAFQCYDLASAAVGADVRVALYDVDPATLAPDRDSLREALAAGARVVVIAPLYGVPVEWESLAGEVEAAGGMAIEDAAQGHGASWKGRPLGSWGSLSVLSFGRGKGWCGGSGGALLARNGWEREAIPMPAPAGMADEARVIVQLKAQLILGRPALYGLPAAIPGLHLGETVYHPPRTPRGMTNAAAAAVRAHADASDREAERRRHWAARLAADVPSSRIEIHPGGAGGFLRYPIRLAAGADEKDWPSRWGVMRSYPTALTQLSALGGRVVGSSPCEGALVLSRELATVPVHSRVTGKDRRGIVEWVQRHAKGWG